MAPWDVPISIREIAIGIMFILFLELVLFSFRFFRRSKRREGNKFDLGFGLFFLFLFCGALIYFLFYYYANATNFETTNMDLAENVILWKLATLLQLLGFGVLFIIAENKILNGKDRYLFLIGYCAMIVMAMIQPTVKLATTWAMLSLIFALFIPISYLYIAKTSEGIIRKSALFVFFGFIIFFLGVELVSMNLAGLIINATGGLISIYHLAAIGYTLRIFALLFFAEGFKETE